MQKRTAPGHGGGVAENSECVGQPEITPAAATPQVYLKMLQRRLALIERRVDPVQRRVEIYRRACTFDGTDAEMIRAAVFLALIEPTKHINKRAGTSGQLKHEAERWLSEHRAPVPYISSTAFTATAIVMGFKVEFIQGSWAAVFNFSSRSLSRLRGRS